MTAYVVFIRDRTTNPAELKTYSEKAKLARSGHALTPLAFYGKHETLEGPPIEGSVILSFPTIEEARAWYHSPLYQEALVHRKLGSEYRLFIVEGVDVPAT